ncbi:hypothetical protein GCM10009654_37440 [Streptomyces hebeiensis]|uniref:Uncharacterized protein n=1 Tax=Streptomyces hebeiensis TaxID=229486 RepID=A0ABP4FGM5_9ACTN
MAQGAVGLNGCPRFGTRVTPAAGLFPSPPLPTTGAGPRTPVAGAPARDDPGLAVDHRHHTPPARPGPPGGPRATTGGRGPESQEVRVRTLKRDV